MIQEIAAREQELRDQVEQARQLATARPTAKNRKALNKVRAELEQYLQDSAEPDTAETTFAGILEVVEYLDGQGWKASKTSAYDHWKKDGKIKARPDGTFTLGEVERYAQDHLQRKDGSAPGRTSLAEERQRQETRRIAADAEMRELRLRERLGELIPSSRVETELSERATNLKGYFDAVARSSAGRIIKLVGGDPQRSPELISYLLGVNRKAFDNYARPIELSDDD